MNMTPVSSSQIKAIGHQPEENRLFVQFNSGSTYSYENVPVEKYQEFLGAKSIGKYFGANIKGQAMHPFKKIEGQPSVD